MDNMGRLFMILSLPLILLLTLPLIQMTTEPSLAMLRETLADQDVVAAILRSVGLSLTAGGLAFFMGTPLAYHPMTAPVMIYERFTAYGLKYSQPVAVWLIFISFALFVVLRMLSRAVHQHYR